MDTTPHMHTPSLKREHFYHPIGDLNRYWAYHWNLTYGDTTVKVSQGPKNPANWKIKKAFEKAVAKHDLGSIKAKEESAVEAVGYLASLVPTKTQQWLSKVQK